MLGSSSASVKSVNIGSLEPNPAKGGLTAFAKRPVGQPVMVTAPGPRKGDSGLAGDFIGDKANHGGDVQAVYAFAREDLDRWEGKLNKTLPDGAFGENLTTLGIDPNEALVGERWQIGGDLVLQVTVPRLPCKTFAAWMAEEGWLRRFTADGRPGAYLSVVKPGLVGHGDKIAVVHKPDHTISITKMLMALTTKKATLPDLLEAGDYLPRDLRQSIEERRPT